jgi:hypothetical protein
MRGYGNFAFNLIVKLSVEWFRNKYSKKQWEKVDCIALEDKWKFPNWVYVPKLIIFINMIHNFLSAHCSTGVN